MLDYCYSVGLTFKQVYELCGLAYPENLRFYEETGCIAYPNGNDRYIVYTNTSTDSKDFLELSTINIQELHNADILKTISWNRGNAIGIIAGREMAIKELLKIS
jgi:DNA-binding transcriptional MerR regulator